MSDTIAYHHHVPDRGVVDDPTGIIQDGFRVDARGDRSPREDLGFDLVNDRAEAAREIRVRPVLGDGGVGEALNGVAAAGSITGPADVDGTATGVDVGTKSVGTVGAARNVRLASVVRDEARFGLNEFVDSSR